MTKLSNYGNIKPERVRLGINVKYRVIETGKPVVALRYCYAYDFVLNKWFRFDRIFYRDVLNGADFYSIPFIHEIEPIWIDDV